MIHSQKIVCLIRCRNAIAFAVWLIYNALFYVHMFLLYQLMRT